MVTDSNTMGDEVSEIKHLIQLAKSARVREHLEILLRHILNEKESEEKQSKSSKEAPNEPPESLKCDPRDPISPQSVPSVGSSRYCGIEKFSWTDDGYNSPFVSIYVPLDGVGEVKDAVSCTFGKSSFDLQVEGLNNSNYRLVKENLFKDIIPSDSKFVVKRDKVVMKLKKVKGEYGYDAWTSLVEKRPGKKAQSKSDDPYGSIMGLMQDMYEEGDDNMKRIIGESMMKSRLGQGGIDPSTPTP